MPSRWKKFQIPHNPMLYRPVTTFIICLSYFLFLFNHNVGTNAKKYYPTYRKPAGQQHHLQHQPQRELLQYYHQPYQRGPPMVTVRHEGNGNKVQRERYPEVKYPHVKQAKTKTKIKKASPSYPNVYSYNKATPPARKVRPVDRDSDVDDNEDEEEDNDEGNSTTPKPKGPRKPPLGGFSLFLNQLTTNQTEDAEGEDAEEDEDNSPAPFGFTEIELSLIPGVKYKVQRLPEWFGAQVQLSYPITFYFEKLDFPEDSPPFPFGRRLFRTELLTPKRNPDRNWPIRDKRSILSLPPTHSTQTLWGGERAHVVPRLENVITSHFRIKNARDCLLKLVCEIHENQVHRTYGFVGKLLTLIFSISRSDYSATHLPSYLAAERMGRAGNCSLYEGRCSYSLFGSDEDNIQQQCDSKSDECGAFDDYDFGAAEDEDYSFG